MIHVLLAALLLDSHPGTPPPDVKNPADLKASPVVAGMNRLAFELFREARSPSANVAISPASLAPAIAMTYEGARGQTAEEIARVFHFPGDREALRRDYRALIRHWGGSGADRPYRLVAGNSLWVQLGFEFQTEYVQLLSKSYSGSVRVVDFRDNPDSGRKAINAWVDGMTQHLISELVAPGVITENTRLVLANAIAFKAQWSYEFHPEATRPDDFQITPGKPVKVAMMRQREELAFTETDDVQMVQMPYRGGDFAMLVVLPKRSDGLDAVEKALTAEGLDGWIAKSEPRRVILSLPKFRAEASLDLTRPLARLGMKEAFVPSADFSGIAENDPLWITSVIHQAVVKVDEEGTEAAAATAVVAAGAIELPAKKPPVVFNVDHPFLYVIRDMTTGAVLFLGHVVDPSR
jgi:serpin B